MIEAQRLHVAGALVWVDGMIERAGLAPAPAEGEFDLALDPLPRLVRAEPRRGALVLHRAPAEPLPHWPDEAERAAPDAPPLAVSGTIRARDGRFHPLRFAATLPPRGQMPVSLHRTPATLGLGAGGGLRLTLRWQDAQAAGGIGPPAAWAIITLALPVNGDTWRWRAQADRHGDLVLPLRGLPPRPRDAGPHALALTAAGDPGQADAMAPDPTGFAACRLLRQGAAAFADALPVEFTPGQVLRLADDDPRILLLKPV
ncbi:hypothetical protein [Paracraurococcus ruber]|uniref:Uncharacterized protein n=1 Tax=Paracraurococcus ruber TaxID=77675 RepID=A0ABS1CRM8_9PROT|nr:hypothetical protein [Paracraurococcus ruber]MBK1657102.1 hypothetical protein [Paracraurococcus ruber]TDG33401.1 hypothetical protein E2C05_04030 [Paracraurococcus ruber]